MQEEQKLKNQVSGAAYRHLMNFITEALHMDPSDLKEYHKALSGQKKVRKIIKRKVLKKENIDNHFGEFENLKKKIHKEFDISKKELKSFTALCVNELTKKETEVIQLLKQGFAYKECAQQLYISESTLKTHVNAIFQKRGVSSLQELIVLELTGNIKGQTIKAPLTKNVNNDALNLLSNLL